MSRVMYRMQSQFAYFNYFGIINKHVVPNIFQARCISGGYCNFVSSLS